jgi:dTMP kinase
MFRSKRSTLLVTNFEWNLMTSTGRLISIEGIDGSGKSTLATNMAAALKRRGFNVLLTKEPGDTTLGKTLREILHTQKASVCDMAEYLLFAADRAQHFHEMIIPELNAGSIIIADRLADSSLAYQGYGRGLDHAMIKSINAWAMNGITPDLTFYLRIDPMTALNRVRRRQEQLTSFEQEALAFWQRVTKGYEAIFATRTNVTILDGSLPMHTLDELALNVVIPLIS